MHEAFFNNLKSEIKGCEWPAIPNNSAGMMLSLQYQFQQNEQLAPEEIVKYQLKQAATLVNYAREHITLYQDRIPGFNSANALTMEDWRKIPILNRSDLQQAGISILAPKPMAGHDKLVKITTSGSTGRPVTVWNTQVSRSYWLAFTLREHLWQKRDFSGKLMSIRPENAKNAGEIKYSPNWGPATDSVLHTGPACSLSSSTPITDQASLVLQENPAYLLSLPSNLRELIKELDKQGRKLSNLKGIRSYGEVCPDEIGQLAQEHLGVPVTDVYSSQELGYIAIQCEHMNLHVLCEGVLLEILDENDQPCPEGKTGRVVATTLQNFSSPLIRYALGDYAEAGPASCPCGRRFPIINKVMGRQRNLVKLPDGSTHWPSFPEQKWSHIKSIRQIQLVQPSLSKIEMNTVVSSPLENSEKEFLKKMIQQQLSYPFDVIINQVDTIERSKSGKFEDFICKV